MFDITKLAATETSTVELVGGDDAPLYDDKGQRLSITVYGPGTKVYQRAQSRQQNLLVDKIKKRGKMDQTAEEKLAEQAEFLAACTVSLNLAMYTLHRICLETVVFFSPFQSNFAETEVDHYSQLISHIKFLSILTVSSSALSCFLYSPSFFEYRKISL